MLGRCRLARERSSRDAGRASTNGRWARGVAGVEPKGGGATLR